jgi:hypothetical protein
MPETSRAGENPYTAPPMAAALTLAPHRLSTKNGLAAEPAKLAVTMTVRLVCGPASSVTGASTSPGSSSEVFHIRLMPCGAFSPVVTRAGSRPCETSRCSPRIRVERQRRGRAADAPG